MLKIPARLLLSRTVVVTLVLAACFAWATPVPALQDPQPSQPATQAPAEETKPPVSPRVPVEAPAAPAAPLQMQPVDPTTFILGAEDIIFVQVWREPEFTRQVMVRPDGKVTMPLIKEVEAAGKTPEQLAKDIAKALGEYLRNPEVAITVMQVNSRKYYVTGEVNRPGSFPLVVPTRVLDAITMAGGFREFANKKKITLLRKGERLKFNYNEVTKGKKMEQNVLLEHGDYVIVP